MVREEGTTRKQDLAVEVENMVSKRGELLKNIGRLTDGFDFVFVDDHGSVLKESALRVHGDDHCIVEYHGRRL